MFRVKESDFTPLEICLPQQKTRSQLQTCIRLYTLFQNNNHGTWYICSISPSISPMLWQTPLNWLNWSENLPLQQLLHWSQISIPKMQTSGKSQKLHGKGVLYHTHFAGRFSLIVLLLPRQLWGPPGYTFLLCFRVVMLGTHFIACNTMGHEWGGHLDICFSNMCRHRHIAVVAVSLNDVEPIIKQRIAYRVFS